ncbi:ABC transporter permease [Arthrobacter luteolus]|uniref:ABC transporter permease n=1 Tax=Arthrobacter luteolus TaxID=98672 RepID=UPI0009F9C46E|nr:ABC transporter permease [Arthrobacter luteolus]
MSAAHRTGSTGETLAAGHTTPGAAWPEPRQRFLGSLYGRNIRAVFARGLKATWGTNWSIMISGFVEPVLYLLAMGIGLGSLIGTVSGPGGEQISYAAYIAPALLAVSAMNGAIYDSTMNVFFKLNFARLYEGMLATSLGPLDVALGEILLALLRGGMYATGFTAVMAAMGLVTSPAALLMIPAAVVIAFGFASIGMAITSYMKTFQQLDWVSFVMLPMFLFSATFYPLSVYPQGIQLVIQALPLWHGVEMLRQINAGAFGLDTAGHLLYFVVMIAFGLVITTRRLEALFQK